MLARETLAFARHRHTGAGSQLRERGSLRGRGRPRQRYRDGRFCGVPPPVSKKPGLPGRSGCLGRRRPLPLRGRRRHWRSGAETSSSSTSRDLERCRRRLPYAESRSHSGWLLGHPVAFRWSGPSSPGRGTADQRRLPSSSAAPGSRWARRGVGSSSPRGGASAPSAAEPCCGAAVAPRPGALMFPRAPGRQLAPQPNASATAVASTIRSSA